MGANQATMNFARFLYNVAIFPLAVAIEPFAYLISRLLQEEKADRWRQRLGFHSPETIQSLSTRPLIWIHAVSVGEVGVASTLIQALEQVRPGLGIVVSTTTPHGQQLAKEKLAPRATCVYFPLDFITAVRRALRRLRPDVIVCLETELWPNFLGEANRLGIPTLLLNGRISQRSFRHYRRISWLMKPLLNCFAALAMSSKGDAERVIGLGAPAGKVLVTGNMKGAGLVEQTDSKRVEDLRQRMKLQSGQPVLIAGSIRLQELSWLPEIFSRLLGQRPDLVGIFAPRHLNRLGRLASCCEQQGLEAQRLSVLMNGAEKRKASVILVDRVGMLFDLYGLGDLIFCGGSLVPLGGQNILEPVAWGKPVFYGSHMNNFLQASQMLESAGCGIRVQDRGELLARLRHFLANPKELDGMGSKGQAVLRDLNHIAIRQAELVRDVLGNAKRITRKGAKP
jgi:3-deoxy-D-manno-octulosonic-acid transferase